MLISLFVFYYYIVVYLIKFINHWALLFSTMKDQKVDVQTLVGIKEEAERLQRQQGEAATLLDIDSFKENLTSRVLAASKEAGQDLLHDSVEKAVDNYISGLYSHTKPSGGLAAGIAGIYVDRKRIFRKYVVPTLITTGALGVMALSALGIGSAIRHGAEKRIEDRAEQAYAQMEVLESGIGSLSASNEAYTDDQLSLIILQANSDLVQPDQFFSKYCTGSDCSVGITQDNYKEAESFLSEVESNLSLADLKLSEGNQLVVLYTNLGDATQTLESLIGKIRGENPPQLLLTQAEAAYSEASSHLQRRELGNANADISALQGIESNIQLYESLPPEIDALCASIPSVAVEPAAKDLGSQLCAAADLAKQNIDIPALNNSAIQLRDLSTILNQEYKMVIVNREGEKTGIDRYDNNTGNLSGYYVIVDAINPTGNPVDVKILNEENGQYFMVHTWGERVPACGWESVKTDKMDDGLVQNGIFGTKLRGYLNPEIIIVLPKCGDQPAERLGQITDW